MDEFDAEYEYLKQCDDARLDDTIHYCPDCERPTQFGGLCEQCRQDREQSRGEEHVP